MLAFISALVVFLGVAFVLTNQTAKKTTSSKKVPTVGILQLETHPALDAIHRGILAGLKEYGYVPGKTVKIDYQNAQGDQSNLKTMSQKFINENADETIAIATPAAQALANAAGKQTPVILAGITDPVGGGLIKSNTKPGANITGTSGESPLKSHLALLRKLVPKAKKIGIIYTTSDHGGEYNAKKFAKICHQAGIAYKLYTISSTNDMQQVAETMASQVDAVYAPQDNGVASAMKTLVSVTNKANIPVIPAVDTMVQDGGLATLSVDQYQLGKLSGEMAARVLKGKATATYPVELITKGKMTLNLSEAKLLGLKFPASVLKEAKQKGVIYK
ncbi:peptide ABC transporter substrate-binding protein [Lactobacillus sp. CBA3605]|uniref:tryptophan ABC transporter substrate-binding protein n=1 Tax=Lactobacillus sp. CBA3605 TaxID=2099788 RepID=UPI000CFAA438|nr:tryptophan ABC transporter substrate-binding protein [Lactobacillus sp. CBA3605]AVK62493.1 peptide ABC transporter substrate-binding protein [Lactobacillus sp. CBA3605]